MVNGGEGVEGVARTRVVTAQRGRGELVSCGVGSYALDVDTVGRAEWDRLVEGFEDATIHQTWALGEVAWGFESTSRLVLRRGGDAVAIGQLRIHKVPLLRLGMAVLFWGPLWRRRGGDYSIEDLSAMLAALRQEYSERRGLCLRVYPRILEEDSQAPEVRAAFARVGFGYERDSEQTLLLDLRPDSAILRRELAPKWRTDLNSSERRGLQIVHGTSEDLFGSFLAMYREMLERKRFEPRSGPERFAEIQKQLPFGQKVRLSLCLNQGRPVAGAMTSIMGKTALVMFWATSPEGRSCKASFFLQWNLIRELKRFGCEWYDLNGVDPERQPGTYRFKAGLCGRDATTVRWIGRFDTHNGWKSFLVVRFGSAVRGIMTKARRIVSATRR